MNYKKSHPYCSTLLLYSNKFKSYLRLMNNEHLFYYPSPFFLLFTLKIENTLIENLNHFKFGDKYLTEEKIPCL